MKNSTEMQLDSMIETCTSQLQIGVLIKNVKRGLLNDGLSEELATKILRIAELKHNEKNHYAAR